MENETIEFFLQPEDNVRLAILCGPQNAFLRQIADFFTIGINNRGALFQIIGPLAKINQAKKIILEIYAKIDKNTSLTPAEINLALQSVTCKTSATIIKTPMLAIKPRTANQEHYLANIYKYDINFAVGPAGTGKTYLAVAFAVQELEQEKVARIIVTRPAVESGEKLGFLPGDIAQKVDPYLRPIYDGLYEMLGFEKVSRLIAHNVIEIAPLAFMRGRTFSDAIIILDEAQNSTIEQMQMFLTRLGFGSKAIVTGDITQIDLPKQQTPGLNHALEILKNIPKIGFTFLQSSDIVRHALVQQIVAAYEESK